MPFNPTRSRISATISSLAENMCVERGTLINYRRRWYYWIPLAEYITRNESALGEVQERIDKLAPTCLAALVSDCNAW